MRKCHQAAGPPPAPDAERPGTGLTGGRARRYWPRARRWTCTGRTGARRAARRPPRMGRASTWTTPTSGRTTLWRRSRRWTTWTRTVRRRP